MRAEVARIVYPVLNYGLKLKERREHGEEPVIDTEQSVLRLLLNSEDGRQVAEYWGDTGANGADDDRFLGIRYALTCWLDEIMIDKSPWGAQWESRTLEWALFRSLNRGFNFRLQAQKAEASADAIEAFMLCVMLGFRGDWLGQRDELQTWVNANQTRIAKSAEEHWPAPPAQPVPRTNVPPLRGWERVQNMRRWRGFIFIVVVMIVFGLVVVKFLH